MQKDTEQINQAATPTAEPTAALSENAAAVQAMVNALPGVDALEAMDAESMANAYAQTDAAYEAYLALSAEEQALITGAQVFEPLFAAFNAQMMTLEETEYSVNIPSTQGGTVTADSTSVSAGATVTLTVSPETGYGLYSLTITDASGTIASTPGEGNTYTFTMPQSDVTINATFERVFEIQLYPKTYEFGNKILTATISGTDYTLTNTDKTSCMLPSGTYTITYNDPGAQYCEKIPDITLTVKDGAIEESSAVQKNKNYGYYTIKPEITRKTYTITGVDKLGGKVHCASTKALSDASLQRTAQFVDKVFLKVTTDKGFSLKEISATDSNGNSIKITPVKDNATSELRYYTVAMPADNVTISATFEVNASEETEAEFRVVGVEGNTSLSKAAPGTNFQQWIKDNSDNPTTNCLWRVTYDGRTTVVDENTVIANGAKYTLVFELVRGDILKIYAPCNSGEIDIEYKNIRVVTDDAQLTVTHIVDGESCTAIFTEGNTTGFDVNFRDYLTICDKYNSKQVWYSSGKKISFDSTLTLNQTEYTSYYPLTTGNMGALRFAVPSTCAGKWNENRNTFNGGAKAGQVVTLNFSVKPDSVTLETASGASVTPNKVSDTVYTFTMPEDAVTINAQAAEKYNVAIGETTNGSVTADVQSAYAGDTVTITDANGETITPTPGEGNTYTFTMPDKDVTVQATFAATFTYLDGSKTATVPAEETPFLTWLEGKDPTLAANTHWHVNRNRADVIVTADTLIQAGDYFVIAWQLVEGKLKISRPCTSDELPDASLYDTFNYEMNHNGSVTVTHRVEGVEKTFTVSDDIERNWQYDVLFAGQNIDTSCTWYFNGEKLSNTAYMPLKPGEFALKHGIQFSAQGGNVTVTNAAGEPIDSALAGDAVTLNVTPEEGYKLIRLRITDASGEPINPTEVDKNTYTFTMPLSDVTIAVAFEQALRIQIYPQYSDIGDVLVKATISSNGYKQKITNKNKTSCILPSGTYTITYEDMDSKYCDAIPDGTLTVNEDGTIQESDTVQQGTDEEGRYYIIKPNITLKGHTVTGADPLGGKVYSKVGSSSAAVKRVAYEGDRVYLEIVADEGFSLNEDSISVTDSSGKPVTVELDGSNRRWFTMPASNVTITATFALTNIAPSYVITIPSTVSLNTASKMTITVSDVENMGDGEQISVQADSANGEQNSLASGKGWLVSGEQHIAYTFDAFLDFDQSGAKDLALTIGEGETDGKPAGTYTDTLQFSVSLTTGE